MNVATALNKKYIPYTTVMLSSLAINNTNHIDVYLFHCELEGKDIDAMSELLSAYDISLIGVCVDMGVYKETLPRNSQWTLETYLRLMMAEYLPEELSRVLYLDADVIVNQDLSELYQLEFNNTDLFAAYDAGKVWKIEQLQPKQQEMLGPLLEQGHVYFNAGVLLFNVDRVKERYSFSRYCDAFEDWNYQMVALDQDILNYVYSGKVSYFDYKKYNLFARVAHNKGMTYEQVKHECAIIHYAGEKPWESENVHYDIEQLWWDYAAKTPLYHELLEGFLHSAMTNTVVEDYIIGLQKDNAELKSTMMQVTEKMKSLFG